MSKNYLQALSKFTLDLAKHAGEIIQFERQHHQMQFNYKADQELVTQADVKTDEFITKHIAKTYPDHRILSEELNADKSQIKDLNRPLWIIDPIDGTVNYAYGHNQVAVSIAYAEQGVVKAGVVHCPFQKETFTAVEGQGAFLNHQPIHVSEATVLSQSLIGTGFPYDKTQIEKLVRRLEPVLKQCRDIRRIGSAAVDICWVACGRLDGFYESLSPWDFAAARLIAKEAGAICGHFTEVPEGIPVDLFGDNIVISNPHIYEALSSILVNSNE